MSRKNHDEIVVPYKSEIEVYNNGSKQQHIKMIKGPSRIK